LSRITPLQILMKWRKYIKTTYKAVKLIIPIIPNAEIYTTEGVVEDRLTVKSDIDKGDAIHASENIYKVVEECIKALVKYYKVPGFEEVQR